MASVGIEGVIFKRLNGAYHPSARGWQKYKVRETSEAIVGAITGSPAVPRTLLLGRYDDKGRLQCPLPRRHPDLLTATLRSKGLPLPGRVATKRPGSLPGSGPSRP